MRNIFTIAYSKEEANEIGHFIMSKGYKDGIERAKEIIEDIIKSHDDGLLRQ